MMSDEEHGIRIRITPEATDEEAAAVAGVIATLAAAMPKERPATPALDRWALAGRREALRGPLWPVEWDGFGRATGMGERRAPDR